MSPGPWKVGELARTTGLTVRALHHYDEIGLLSPSGRTDGGHRLYTRGDVKRLQHIMALRHLGFTLEQIAAALADPAASPLAAIAALRQELKARLAATQDLDDRLAAIESSLARGDEVSTGRLLQVIEGLSMYERYLSKEQLADIQARTAAMDPSRVRDTIDTEWPQLVAAVRAEADRGTDPTDPRVKALAAQWTALTEAFTGGDPAMTAALHRLYAEDPEGFARDKVGRYGDAAVADLARCVRYIAQAFAVY